MAKLTAKARKDLPSKDFAGPDRSYPVEDRGHAIAAKSRASAAEDAGRMSESTEEKIDAKANKVLRPNALARFRRGGTVNTKGC